MEQVAMMGYVEQQIANHAAHCVPLAVAETQLKGIADYQDKQNGAVVRLTAAFEGLREDMTTLLAASSAHAAYHQGIATQEGKDAATVQRVRQGRQWGMEVKYYGINAFLALLSIAAAIYNGSRLH